MLRGTGFNADATCTVEKCVQHKRTSPLFAYFLHVHGQTLILFHKNGTLSYCLRNAMYDVGQCPSSGVWRVNCPASVNEIATSILDRSSPNLKYRVPLSRSFISRKGFPWQSCFLNRHYTRIIAPLYSAKIMNCVFTRDSRNCYSAS